MGQVNTSEEIVAGLLGRASANIPSEEIESVKNEGPTLESGESGQMPRDNPSDEASQAPEQDHSRMMKFRQMLEKVTRRVRREKYPNYGLTDSERRDINDDVGDWLDYQFGGGVMMGAGLMINALLTLFIVVGERWLSMGEARKPKAKPQNKTGQEPESAPDKKPADNEIKMSM